MPQSAPLRLALPRALASSLTHRAQPRCGRQDHLHDAGFHPIDEANACDSNDEAFASQTTWTSCRLSRGIVGAENLIGCAGFLASRLPVDRRSRDHRPRGRFLWPSRWKYPEPLTAFNPISVEVRAIDGKYGRQPFTPRQIDQRGVSEIHRPIPIARHERVDFGQF
jgi:hypothetical protein